MGTYIIRRLLLLVPTLLGVTALVFTIMKMAPGDVAEMLISREGMMQAGDRAARVEYINERYGLDDPAVVQYFRWLNDISPVGAWSQDPEEPSRGWGIAIGEDEQGRTRRLGFKIPDLGESFVKNRPVADLVAEALPITLLLNLVSIPLVYGIAIVTGLYAARHRGGVFDITSSSAMLGLWSIPTIWAGVLLIGFLANQEYAQVFPTAGLHEIGSEQMRFLPSTSEAGFERGWLLDMLWHLALPVICLSYAGFAFLSKLTRGAVLENLRADFVRTARAKGVGDKDVLWHHVFRNSLLPLITVAAHIIPSLLAGSIIVEVIFSIPGMGKLMVQSIEFKDQEVVMTITLISGVLTLASYLVADLLYAVADPRVSYE